MFTLSAEWTDDGPTQGDLPSEACRTGGVSWSIADADTLAGSRTGQRPDGSMPGSRSMPGIRTTEVTTWEIAYTG